MSESKTTASTQTVVIGWIGVLLVRLIVPVWIIYGAAQKATGGTPKSLPRSILDASGKLGITDHFFLLASLVSIEFLFVAFMLFSPKLAKRAGIVMLGTFLVVLCVEMFGYGNFESCGCFGEKSLSPMAMFAIDFALLLGIIFVPKKRSNREQNHGVLRLILVLAFTAVTSYVTFTTVMGHKPSESTNIGDKTSTPLPASWYPQNIGDWIDKPVDDIALFGWVKEWPIAIDEGKQYVIFYSLTCDHCEALLWEHFEFPTIPTTLVAIPQSTDGFNYDGAFDNPCLDCQKTELRIGTDWIIGSPLVVALENGIVKCATENEEYEAPACLIH
ncbi:MAG: hypothetical protein H8E86_04220 [Planctomycetes bacterium]|nr:hypothetical protein [Planctomycetota bacterium]